MTHEHSAELKHQIVTAAITGQPVELPPCCLPDLLALAAEMLDDDRVLSSEFVA